MATSLAGGFLLGMAYAVFLELGHRGPAAATLAVTALLAAVLWRYG